MKRPVIIGYGNPLRQDDAMGWRAAELVERSLPEGAAEVVQCHQLAPELAVKLKNASFVLFLDASVEEAPGCIGVQAVRAQEPGAWTHHLMPGQLLNLARRLNGAAPNAFLISGGPVQMGLGDAMSATAAECTEQMAALAVRMVDSATAGSSNALEARQHRSRIADRWIGDQRPA